MLIGETMKENIHKVWMAVGELGDWFSRLGGAARYQGFSDSEIPLYIGCKLVEMIDDDFNSSEYYGKRFIEAAGSSVAKADSILKGIDKSNIDELRQLVVEFVKYSESKTKDTDTIGWKTYKEYVAKHIA